MGTGVLHHTAPGIGGPQSLYVRRSKFGCADADMQVQGACGGGDELRVVANEDRVRDNNVYLNTTLISTVKCMTCKGKRTPIPTRPSSSAQRVRIPREQLSGVDVPRPINGSASMFMFTAFSEPV